MSHTGITASSKAPRDQASPARRWDSAAYSSSWHELIRPDSSADALGTLKPSFAGLGDTGFDLVARERYPQVEHIDHQHHAGNSSGLADGAALLLLGNEAQARRWSLSPKGRVVATAVVGTEPTIMLTGPYPAAQKALAVAGLSADDIDLWEINEAFASVVMRSRRIAIDDASIRLGLPEVTLGVLPGVGGVSRLVRMLGLEKALPLLTEGRLLTPEEAEAAGVIDERVADTEALLARAREWIKAKPEVVAPWDQRGFRLPGGGPSHPRIAQMISVAPAMIRRKTQGCYPAPLAILATAVEGADLDIDAAGRVETRYCDLIIEAVYEDLELKTKVTQVAETQAKFSALIASNTSTLPITDLADAVSQPERFVGLHFFSPVDKMPLVEIIAGRASSGQRGAAGTEPSGGPGARPHAGTRTHRQGPGGRLL